MIPVNEPLLLEEDFASVDECMRSGWVSSAGPQLEQFERDWAAYCGVAHGVAVSNGTTALQVAVEAVGIGAGDEVIMPSFTIVSLRSAVVRAGGTPVLVDCDPVTFCMDPAQVAARVTPRTKAVMVVHMYGHPVDMDPILRVARRHGLRVIEDAAEVHGAEYLEGRATGDRRWRRCGGIGDIATFSFFANKLITTGEGGMLVTADDELARRCRSLRNLCFQPSRRFLHDEHGWQFRMTSLQAALGLRQIGRMDGIMARKRWAAAAYTERLRDLRCLQLPAQMDWARSVYWVYGLVLADDVAFDAQEFARRLAARGVETRPFFLGMHEQPVFHRLGLFEGERYPVTERIARRGLYLPSGLALTEAQIDAAAAATREVLREVRMSQVFQDDYASGYDALYREKDYGAECNLVEKALAVVPGERLRLLDVGCGTGGHALELARRGHHVAGVDLSEDMLGHARRKGAASSLDDRLEFVQGDARSFRLSSPPFDAAIMMFAVLGYIVDNDGLLSALSTVRTHLKPGARFCCDFWWGPAVLTDRPGERVRTVDTGRGELLRATRTTLDTVNNVAEVRFDLFRFDAGTPASRSRETHRMRYFFGPELELMFRLAGFEIERLGQFPGLDEAPTDRSWNAMLVARAV